MAKLQKEFVLKSVDIDIETGNINLKWMNRIVEEDGNEKRVLHEMPHRKTIAKDDTDTLNAEISDPNLRDSIKKIAKWNK